MQLAPVGDLAAILDRTLKGGKAYERRARAVTSDVDREYRRSSRRRRGRGRGSRRGSASLGKLDLRKTETTVGDRFAAGVAKGLTSAGTLEKGAKLYELTRGVPLKELGTVGITTGALVGAAAIAGIAALAVTSAGINRYVRTLEDRRENAFKIAQAYRQARIRIEEKQRQPLTSSQFKDLKYAFDRELGKLGLSTKNLGGLNQSFFERGF